MCCLYEAFYEANYGNLDINIVLFVWSILWSKLLSRTCYLYVIDWSRCIPFIMFVKNFILSYVSPSYYGFCHLGWIYCIILNWILILYIFLVFIVPLVDNLIELTQTGVLLVKYPVSFNMFKHELTFATGLSQCLFFFGPFFDVWL